MMTDWHASNSGLIRVTLHVLFGFCSFECLIWNHTPKLFVNTEYLLYQHPSIHSIVTHQTHSEDIRTIFIPIASAWSGRENILHMSANVCLNSDFNLQSNEIDAYEFHWMWNRTHVFLLIYTHRWMCICRLHRITNLPQSIHSHTNSNIKFDRIRSRSDSCALHTCVCFMSVIESPETIRVCVCVLIIPTANRHSHTRLNKKST